MRAFKRLIGMTLVLCTSALWAIAIPSAAMANNIAQYMDMTSVNKLNNGLAWYGLMMAMVGICISGALWALGAQGQNAGTELIGKKGIVVCCTAAFFIGAVPTMANWLFDRASDADRTGITNNQAFPAQLLTEEARKRIELAEAAKAAGLEVWEYDPNYQVPVSCAPEGGGIEADVNDWVDNTFGGNVCPPLDWLQANGWIDQYGHLRGDTSWMWICDRAGPLASDAEKAAHRAKHGCPPA